MALPVASVCVLNLALWPAGSEEASGERRRGGGSNAGMCLYPPMRPLGGAWDHLTRPFREQEHKEQEIKDIPGSLDCGKQLNAIFATIWADEHMQAYRPTISAATGYREPFLDMFLEVAKEVTNKKSLKDVQEDFNLERWTTEVPRPPCTPPHTPHSCVLAIALVHTSHSCVLAMALVHTSHSCVLALALVHTSHSYVLAIALVHRLVQLMQSTSITASGACCSA